MNTATRIILVYVLGTLFVAIVDGCYRWYKRYRMNALYPDPSSRHYIRRNSRLVFNTNSDHPSVPSVQLDPTILASLPMLDYGDECLSLECSVCITEFEIGERVRLLPKCKHCFHIECIDMWFLSHSTCPLCRSVVERFNMSSGAIWKRMLTISGRTATISPTKPAELDLESGVGESKP